MQRGLQGRHYPKPLPLCEEIMITLFAVVETLPYVSLTCVCLFLALLGAFLYTLYTEKSPTLVSQLLMGILAISIVFWWTTGFSLTALLALNGFLFLHMVSVSAKQEVKKQKIAFLSPFEFAEASLEDYTWLDPMFYQESRQELESFGFYVLLDGELLHLTRAWPNMRTFARFFVRLDDDICVLTTNIKTVKPRNRIESELNVRMVELRTEFSDGFILCTNNVKGINAIEDVEGFVNQQYPPTTPIKTLLEYHEKKRDEICEERDCDTIVIADKDGWLASCRRGHAINAKDRLTKGFVTDEEYRRIGTQWNIDADHVEKSLKEHRRHVLERASSPRRRGKRGSLATIA